MSNNNTWENCRKRLVSQLRQRSKIFKANSGTNTCWETLKQIIATLSVTGIEAWKADEEKVKTSNTLKIRAAFRNLIRQKRPGCRIEVLVKMFLEAKIGNLQY